MDDIDRAILCLFDEKSEVKVKGSAENYINEVLNRKDFWKILFKKLFIKEQKKEIIFYSIQKLIEFFQSEQQKDMIDEEREQIRKALISWIFEIMIKNNMEAYIKNKFCQLLVSVFRIE
jgi:hypothetical protein